MGFCPKKPSSHQEPEGTSGGGMLKGMGSHLSGQSLSWPSLAKASLFHRLYALESLMPM
jgi:hypothetical protein